MKDLLDRLSYVELHLNDFPFEELRVDEAIQLQESFLSIKKILDANIFPSIENMASNLFKELKLNGTTPKSNKVSDQALADLGHEAYDAVVDHYMAYRSLLKSLKIETTVSMEKNKGPLLGETDSKTDESEIIIDLQPMLKECMDEIDLLTELVVLYQQNVLEFLGAAKLHLQNTDFVKLQFVTHKIKAGLAMMRTDSLHSIVVQMENTCKQDQDIKHLQFLYDCFASEYPAVKIAMDNALNSLRNA